MRARKRHAFAVDDQSKSTIKCFDMVLDVAGCSAKTLSESHYYWCFIISDKKPSLLLLFPFHFIMFFRCCQTGFRITFTISLYIGVYVCCVLFRILHFNLSLFFSILYTSLTVTYFYEVLKTEQCVAFSLFCTIFENWKTSIFYIYCVYMCGNTEMKKKKTTSKYQK